MHSAARWHPHVKLLAGGDDTPPLHTMIFEVRLTFTLYLLLRCHRSTATKMEFFMRLDTTCTCAQFRAQTSRRIFACPCPLCQAT